MILYLIRHGRQNSPLCNLDVPLSPEGKRQAELLGKRMFDYPVDVLYTSSLIRAEETGRIAFRKRHQLIDNLQIREELCEIDFGSLTGAEDATVKRFYGEYYHRQLSLFQNTDNASKKAFAKDTKISVRNFFIPQEDMRYPQGENSTMVLKRVLPVIEEWIASPYKHIAVVTHGGVIRTLLSAFFGGDTAKRLMFGTSLENCSITQMHYDESLGGFFLDRFNDFAHIEAEPELLRSRYLKPNENIKKT